MKAAFETPGVGGEVTEIATGEIGDRAVDGGGDRLAILRGVGIGEKPAIDCVRRELVVNGQLGVGRPG